MKALIGVAVLGVVAFVAVGVRDLVRDKSVIPQSRWTDSENMLRWVVPGVKWIFPGLGELLNVYGFTWIDMREGDFDLLRVEGTFPACRYFSISVHTKKMGIETYRLMDHEIVPDEGYVNPFVVGNERLKDQRYTVYLVKQGVEVDRSLKNVLYIPDSFTSVAISTRQYRADDDTPVNQVARPYPVITALHQDMTRGIAPPALSMDWDALNVLDFDQFEQSYDKQRAFQVDNGNPDSIDFLAYSGEAMGPSADNRYLMTTLGGDFSKVAVIGIPQPPTYEETRKGAPLTGGKNVRYWSICHAEGRMGMVNACVNDDRMPRNGDGSVTLVVGPEEVRDAVERAGLTYMPWTRNRTLYMPIVKMLYSGNPTFDSSRVGRKTMLAFRQVLADPEWDGAISRKVTKYYDLINGPEFDPSMDERAEVLLGDAGPRGFILSVEAFKAGLAKGDFNRAFGSDHRPSR